MIRKTVHYSGRVQGVGFRYTTRNTAAAFPVTGYVMNLHDGRVLLVAEGEPTQVDAFLKAVDEAMGRQIRAKRVESSPPTNEFKGFVVRYE